MRELFRREIPTLGFASMQDYILHEDSSLAILVTNDKEKVIDRLEKEEREITEIQVERNSYGLNDYRIITRKSSLKI